MQPLPIKPEEVLQHHLKAFVDADVAELIKDYTQESEVWGPEGAMVGLDAIAAFYAYAFTLLPKNGTTLEIIQQIVKGDKAYIVWRAESAQVSIPIGADNFQIVDGKIVWQSLVAQIIPKS